METVKSLVVLVLLIVIGVTVILFSGVSLKTQPQQNPKQPELVAINGPWGVEQIPADLAPLVLSKLLSIDPDPCPGKNTKTLEDFKLYDFKKIDLNEDGIDEFILGEGLGCGLSLRGGFGNGTFEVYQKINGIWKEIASALQGNNLDVLTTKHHGYLDLQTYFHNSTLEGALIMYQYENGNYVYSTSTSVQCTVDSPC